MTALLDEAARLVRIRKSAVKHTRNNTAGVQTITLDAKCVAFIVANTGLVRCRYRMDGTNPTVAIGFPLNASEMTPWFEVDNTVSRVVMLIIEESGTKDIEVLEILDQPPAA